MKEENINKKETKENVKEVKKGKNKLFIVVITILIIALVGIIGYTAYINLNNKESRAKKYFGNDNCESILHMSTMDIAEHACKICGETFYDSSMREDICDTCAKDTNRCNFCGKKLTDEIKKQREEIQNPSEQ